MKDFLKEFEEGERKKHLEIVGFIKCRFCNEWSERISSELHVCKCKKYKLHQLIYHTERIRKLLMEIKN